MRRHLPLFVLPLLLACGGDEASSGGPATGGVGGVGGAGAASSTTGGSAGSSVSKGGNSQSGAAGSGQGGSAAGSASGGTAGISAKGGNAGTDNGGNGGNGVSGGGQAGSGQAGTSSAGTAGTGGSGGAPLQLPEGDLTAIVTATREVIRMPASGGKVGDSETTLKPGTNGAITSHRWTIVQAETGKTVATYDTKEPTFVCPENGRGTYDVRLVVSDGKVQSERRHRRLITCTLPRVTAGRPEFTIDVTGKGGYFPEGKINGQVVPPGAIIRVKGKATDALNLLNFQGTQDKPIHVINEGLVSIDTTNTANATKLLHFVNCQHLVLDGLGDDAVPYGFVVRNPKANGEAAVFFRNYTEGASVSTPLTDIEIFGVHVNGAHGSGINVNTHGSAEHNRKTFTAKHLLVHHTLVEDTNDEGFYIGYTRDWVGQAEDYPGYQIEDAKIYRNTLRRTGADGVQVCNLQKRMEVHDNVVEDTGLRGEYGQSSSLQFNAGNQGHVFANVFRGGEGVNMQVGCTGGDAHVFSNVIDHPKGDGAGIYVIAGRSKGVRYHVFDNTIVSSQSNGALVNLGGGNIANVDCADGTTAGAVGLERFVLINNVVVVPATTVGGAAAKVFRLDSPGAVGASWLTTPNLTREPAAVADLCFKAFATGDFALACDTSAGLAKTGTPLSSVEGLDAASLPLGAYTDLAGRVLADPRGYGAYQSR